MKKSDSNIKLQEQRPERASGVKPKEEKNTFCTQDMLRDRIKAVEKAYNEIKSNFHKSLSSIS